MESNKKIISYLKNNDFFYIITHMYPDGDALGFWALPGSPKTRQTR